MNKAMQLSAAIGRLIPRATFAVPNDVDGREPTLSDVEWMDDRPMPTQAEVDGAMAMLFMDAVTVAVQQRLDEFAQTRAYDGILSAATYATSSVAKFAAEGQYAVNARDAHWAKCYEIEAAVKAGSRPMPASVDEVLAEMPPLAWPV